MRFRLIVFIVFLFCTNLCHAQNLIQNESFRHKNKYLFQNYVMSHKKLAKWDVLLSMNICIASPVDIIYIDTTWYRKMATNGLTQIQRKRTVKPQYGSCYIKSNSFKRTLFYQKLKQSLNPLEAYIVLFKYQTRSWSNEHNKIATAKFGVSFSIDPITNHYFLMEKLANKVSFRFRDLFFVNEYLPISNKNWTLGSFSFYPLQAYNYLYLGNHTNFKTAIIPSNKREGTEGEIAVYQDSFLWFVDNIKLLKLSDFLNSEFEQLKHIVLEIPIMNIQDYRNDKLIRKLIKVLKSNKHKYANVFCSINSKQYQNSIIEYFNSNGITIYNNDTFMKAPTIPANIDYFLKSKNINIFSNDALTKGATLHPYRKETIIKMKILIL